MQPLMQFPTRLPILLKNCFFHGSAEISWQTAADPLALMSAIKPQGSVHVIGSLHQKGTSLENLSSMMFHASDISHKFWRSMMNYEEVFHGLPMSHVLLIVTYSSAVHQTVSCHEGQALRALDRILLRGNMIRIMWWDDTCFTGRGGALLRAHDLQDLSRSH